MVITDLLVEVGGVGPYPTAIFCQCAGSTTTGESITVNRSQETFIVRIQIIDAILGFQCDPAQRLHRHVQIAVDAVVFAGESVQCNDGHRIVETDLTGQIVHDTDQTGGVDVIAAIIVIWSYVRRRDQGDTAQTSRGKGLTWKGSCIWRFVQLI